MFGAIRSCRLNAHASRQRGLPLSWLFSILLALASAGALAEPAAGAKDLPFVLRPGDVVANAPLGVKRPVATVIERQLWSPALGVRRPVEQVAEARLFVAPTLGVLRGAGVRSVDPARVSLGQADQQLSLSGHGLQQAASLQFEPADGIAVVSLDAASDGQSLQVALDVASDASVGKRQLRVLRADGSRIPPLTSEAGQLLVAADAPIIDSIAPVLLNPGDAATLVIRGRHLRGLPIVSRGDVNQPIVRVLPADQISVGDQPTYNDAGTEVTVPIQIAATAALGPRRVELETLSGVSAAEMTPANTLHISSQPYVVRSPWVSPLLRVQRGSAAPIVRDVVGVAVGVVRGDYIADIAPTAVELDSEVQLTVTGRGLSAASDLRILPAHGIEQIAGSFSASNEQVQVRLLVSADAQLVPRKVEVQLPSKSLVAPRLLQIRDRQPQITALRPTYLLRDGSSQTIELQGSALSQTTAVRLISDQGLIIESYEALGAEAARMVLRAAPDAALGARLVQVSSPSSSSIDQPTPGNTLFVRDRNQVLTPLVSPLLGVRRGNAQHSSQLDFHSPLLRVVRGAYADRVSPNIVRRGQTTQLRVEGRGLDQVTSVVIADDQGITLSTPQLAADGLSLSFDLTIAADAAPGKRRVDLQRVSSLLPFVPQDSAIFEIDDNDADVPEGTSDSYNLHTNALIDVPAIEGVLSNDFNPQGGAMLAVLRSLPNSGTLNLRSDGSFVYTPNADFVGNDRFEYSPANADAIGNSTSVTLRVTERDDAVNDEYLIADNQVLEVDAANGLLSNDRITAGAAVAIVLENAPSRGSLILANDGSFRYTPNGTPGTEVLRYRLQVDGLRSLPAEFRIIVQDVNEAPIAEDDSYVTDRGVRLDVPKVRGVLSNDSDPDGDVLQARLLENPAIGSLSLNSDGSFSYTAPSDFVGSVSFRYEAQDPRGLRVPAEVRITVNDTLAAADDSYVMNEGEVLFVDEVSGLLANDSVFPQGPLRVIIVDQPELGVLQAANDGSFVYTPNSTDVSGIDEFIYRLQDDRVSSPTARARIEIRGVNDPPVAVADSYLTDENAQLAVAAPGVLDNDTDVEDDLLSAELVRQAEHGTVTLRADGSFTYIPEVNFRGNDTFEYAANDGNSSGPAVQVRIQVTQPPTATNDVYLVDVDTPIEITDRREGLLVNDHDAPENDPLTALIDTLPEHGDLLLNPDGTFLYAPDPGYSGLDVWTYQVTDGRSKSNVGTVTMAVGITSLPRAVPDEYETVEDGELIVPAAEGLLINDLDADTPLDELEAYLVGRARLGGSGLDVTVNLDGSFRVKPWPNFFGETFFVYQAYDGTDISNGAVVKIIVHPVNDGVNAEDDAYGVIRNTVFDTNGSSWPIRRNDSWDGDFTVNFEIVDPPVHGSATIDPVSGRLIYTPGQDFAGTDQLTYRLFQVDTGISDTAVVRFRVNAPPEARPDSYSVTEDSLTEVSPSPLANDVDADGDPLELAYSSFSYYLHGTHIVLSVDDRQNPTVTQIRTQGHYYGTAVFNYVISDGTQQDRDGKITVTVAPVPDAPITMADSYLTQRDTPLSISSVAQGLLKNDYDPDTRPYAGGPQWPAASGADLLPIKAELVSTTSHGQLSLSDTGTFYYVPQAGYSGVDQFIYRVRDGTGRVSADTTVNIRVNSPAQAADDAYVATEDVVLVVPAAEGLLINDSDIDGDAIYASAAGGCAPCHGRVTIQADGSFRYTPDRDYHGLDEFYYRVSDGIAGQDVGRVSITVLPVNDAPIPDSDTYRTREDEVLVAPEPQGVMRNDREVDGDGLERSEMLSEASHGAVEFQPDGSFTYTPDVDFNGDDSFRYRVYDTTGLYADEIVEIHVTPVNDAPTAVDDSYSTPMDQELWVAADAGVLINDSDVDGPNLSVSLIGPPQHGQLSLQPDGGFRYQPNGFFSGVDQFRYQIDDGLGALAVGTALIQVTSVDPEVEVVGENDFYRFEGPRLEINAPGVLGNDRIDGAGRDTLQAELAIPPNVGTLQLNADGSFVFQAPDGYVGLLGFTYVVRSGDATALARVSLDVQRTVNVPPQAFGESYGVLEDAILDSRPIASLLANDRDHERAPLQLEVLDAPEHGQLELLTGGHFVYRPNPNFHGNDRLRYRVSDGQAWSQPAEAALSVFAQNDTPEAQDDIYRVEQDVALQVATADGVLSNDIDVDGDTLMVELVDAPRKGQLQMDPEGGFIYLPLPGAIGEDSFRYAASDLLALATATVRLNIARDNQPPLAQGERYVIDEDHLLNSRSVGGLLRNDSDPDGDALSVILVELPAHGELELDGQHFRYRPTADFFGQDAFLYQVSDGEFLSDTVTAEIEVTAVNDAPRVQHDLYSVIQGNVLLVDAAHGVLVNDRDVESDPLTLSVHGAPGHGTLQLAADGSFRYQPNAAFNGRDEFIYRLSDGRAQALGRVAIDVTRGSNVRPQAQGERYSLAEDTVFDSRSFSSLLSNDSDPEGVALSLVPIEEPNQGLTEWLPNGHVRYTPVRDQWQPVEIRYAVSDGEMQSDSVALRIEYLPQNDPPQAVADLYYLPPGLNKLEAAVERGVLVNDSDPDGDALVTTVVSGPEHGQLLLNLDGSFDYQPNSPRAERDGFRYRASDAQGESGEAEVLLLMDPQSAPTSIFKDSFESPQP
ncbi:Ig-like domain-containing protein [Pseudomarimonas arenosa]|uniref:Tandem-95 repeat protein n=1 Tax=Pseudomarimonas arenosa TaxID=2774145 RepID=A0AAW3ZKQ4_9GAMM|nr:Ig-like domain-containing protein [Pseudomarimonas arenosa]MBD8525505.1 tandem-95 repeat protein [Pseudomarimonas arenosa]